MRFFFLTLVKNGRDTIDRIIGFPELTDRRLTATVYHHFQGWFNSSGINEGVAQDSITALAVPYNREQQVKADFSYWEHDQFAYGRAGGLQVAHRSGPFTIERFLERIGSTRKSDGHVVWKSLDLETYGDACLGTDFLLQYDSESKKLYRMYSYSVLRPIQNLSLLLGLGSLAHHASQDMTEHDVFADVQWDKGIKWPFPIPVAHI